MSQPQHSPGPWTFDGESVWDADNCYVCSKVTPGNGRVIKAAPDMLRLLRVLCWPYDIPWDKLADQVMEARELIARLDGAE